MKKISGKTYYMRKTADYLGVALLLSLLYLLCVLYQGPLSVPFLKPYIMQALNSEESEFSVDVGEVNLELVRSIQPVKIIAKDVILRQNDDEFSMHTPKLSLSFSVRALLKGIVAPSSITLEDPEVAIFTTYGVEKNKENEANKKKLQFYFAWFEDFLERFNSNDDIYPESFVNEITVNNAGVEFHEVDLGRKWRFQDVNFHFERNLLNLEISAGGVLDMTDRMATLAIGGEYRPASNKLALKFDFSDLVLSDIVSIFGTVYPKIEVPVEGKLGALIDFSEILAHKDNLASGLDKIVEKIVFDVTGSAGEVLFNEDEKFNYGIDAFVLNGSISGDLNSISIKDADFSVGGQNTRLSLDISGYQKYFFEKSLEDLKVVFSADIPQFALNDLSKFWPRYLAEPAWAWCKENLYGGNAQNGHFDFVFGFDPQQKVLVLTKLDGRADVADSNISYLEGMPVVNHVYGTAFFSSSDIDIKVDKGVSEGVIITGGNVRLYDLDKYHNYIDIKIKGNSSVTDALKFIDHPPLNYAQEMGLNPEAVSGDVEIALGLNFELYEDLKPEEIKVDVKADLTQVKMPNVAEGKDLTAEKMAVEVNSDGFIVLGDAEFDGIPVNILINETFKNEAYKTKGKFTLKVDDAVKKKLGVETSILSAPYIEGYADVAADLTVLGNHKAQLDIDADLTHAAIDYSFLGFKKEAGKWGKIKAKLEFTDDKLSDIPSFSLEKSDFRLDGRVNLDDDGRLKSIDITNIDGPKTSAKAQIEFAGDIQKSIKINISGDSYDLTELFAQSDKPEEKIVDNSETDGGLSSVPDGEIFIAVNSLWTNPKTPIKNFAGSAVLKNGIGFEEVHMVGNYGSDKSIKLKLDYEPKPNGEYMLSIDSNNAGSTLRVLRLYDDMSGGILKIEAKRNADGDFIGHAQIRDFSIYNTPLLAKLLTVASFTGILDLLRGDGLVFSHFDAPFEYKNETLYINDAKMFGNVIGFTGSGSYRRGNGKLDIKGIISPAYSLNTLIGRIPVVGSMLAGKDGTVFAASYGIKGSAKNPKISINPLSVFSPNSVKDLFSSSVGESNAEAY